MSQFSLLNVQPGSAVIDPRTGLYVQGVYASSDNQGGYGQLIGYVTTDGSGKEGTPFTEFDINGTKVREGVQKKDPWLKNLAIAVVAAVGAFAAGTAIAGAAGTAGATGGVTGAVTAGEGAATGATTTLKGLASSASTFLKPALTLASTLTGKDGVTEPQYVPFDQPAAANSVHPLVWLGLAGGVLFLLLESR